MNRWAWLGLFGFLFSTACDSGTLDPCDIREPTCQRTVFVAVQRVRTVGWDPWLDMPPTRVITENQFRNELLRTNSTPSTSESHFEATLEAFLLVDPERDPTAEVDALVANYAAYYSQEDRTVTIIDHGSVDNLEYVTVVLAHEFVHAAQDRDLDLDTYSIPDTEDGWYARSALVEGEATLYENLVFAEIRGFSVDEIDWDTYHETGIKRRRTQIAFSPSPYYDLRTLLYPLGSRYMTQRFLEGGAVAIRNAWRTPPKTTLEIISGESEQTPRSCGDPQPPSGYEAFYRLHMGAIPFYGLATRVLEEEEAWSTTLQLDTDTLWIFGSPTGQTISVWDIRLREDATTFAQAAHQRFDHVFQDGHRVVIMQADLPEPSDWDDWMQCSTS